MWTKVWAAKVSPQNDINFKLNEKITSMSEKVIESENDYNFIFDLRYFMDISDYILIVIFIGVSIFIACILVYVSIVFTFIEDDVEKTSSYECGFQPFEDTRQKFDIKYYLVAILFIVFDIEIMCIVPWTQSYEYTTYFGLIWLFIFLLILAIGFYYEWVKGALSWS